MKGLVFFWNVQFCQSLLICTLIAWETQEVEGAVIRIGVASNFMPTMKLLVASYQPKKKVTFLMSQGSSGTLYRQAMNGAPFDLLLSADLHRPKQLAAAGKGERPFIYARGQLAFWYRQEDFWGPPEKLSFVRFAKIAIAQPKIAPYGQAAWEFLSHLKVLPIRKNTLLLGNSVAQAMQFAFSDQSTVAAVSLSQIVALPPEKRGMYWVIPRNQYQPIVQGGTILTASNNKNLVKKFVKFICSSRGQKIMALHGYSFDLKKGSLSSTQNTPKK